MQLIIFSHRALTLAGSVNVKDLFGFIRMQTQFPSELRLFVLIRRGILEMWIEHVFISYLYYPLGGITYTMVVEAAVMFYSVYINNLG